MKKKAILLLFVLIIFLVFLGVALQRYTADKFNSQNSYISFSATPALRMQREKAVVSRVVDGDTIQLQDGRKVRYIGINTPETVDPRRPVQCFGKEASSRNRELVEGKEIEMEKDVSETDKYKRLLRYVYINGVFVNDFLVRNGYARATSYPPDVKYQRQFLEAEKEAKLKNIGLWGVC